MKTSLLCFSVLLFAATQLSAQFKLNQQRHLGGAGDDFSPKLSVVKNGSMYIGGTSNSDKSVSKSQNSRGGSDYEFNNMYSHRKCLC
jgi:hypothetical protein